MTSWTIERTNQMHLALAKGYRTMTNTCNRIYRSVSTRNKKKSFYSGNSFRSSDLRVMSPRALPLRHAALPLCLKNTFFRKEQLDSANWKESHLGLALITPTLGPGRDRVDWSWIEGRSGVNLTVIKKTVLQRISETKKKVTQIMNEVRSHQTLQVPNKFSTATNPGLTEKYHLISDIRLRILEPQQRVRREPINIYN